MPIEVVLEMLNIDPDITRQKLESDLFTVNDSVFNEFLRAAYSAAGNDFASKTDILERLARSMHLTFKDQSDSTGDQQPAGDSGLRFASEEVAPPPPTPPVVDPRQETQSISDDLALLLSESHDNPEKIKFLADIIRKRKEAEAT